MHSMTGTTFSPPEVGTLVLATVADTYRAGPGAHATLGSEPFYVGTSNGLGSGYATILVRDDDPRYEWGFWEANKETHRLPDDGHEYKGWNIPTGEFRPYPAPDSTLLTVENMTPGTVVTRSAEESSEVAWAILAHDVEAGTVTFTAHGWSATRTTRPAEFWGEDSAYRVFPADAIVVGGVAGPGPFSASRQYAVDRAREVLAGPSPDLAPDGETFTREDVDRAVRHAVAESNQRHQQWVEDLSEDARAWADENSLCSEFDRFMQEHGLEGRTREFEVRLTYVVTVTASDRDDAVDVACEQVTDGIVSLYDTYVE